MVCIKPNSDDTLYEVIEVKEFVIKIKSKIQEMTTVASMFRLATEKELKKKHLKQIFYRKS